MKGKGISSWPMFRRVSDAAPRGDIAPRCFTIGQLSLPSYGYAAEVRATRRLFLIRWNLWQNRRLQQPFLFLLSGINWQSARINQPRRHENDEIAFDVLIDVGAEEASNQGNIADDRDFIFCLLHVFTHQSTEHNRLAVPDTYARGHLARAENRLVNHIISEKNGRNRHATNIIRIHSKDSTAVINETFELDHLRHQIQIDGHSIGSYHRFNL